MPRAVKNQGYETDSTAQEALKDKPPFWVKLTDVFGETLVTTVSNIIWQNNPVEYGAVTAVPYAYFAKYGSHHAAEAVMQSSLNLQKEYIKIDPVALFPGWENGHLMFPERFVEPTLEVTCSILKENSTLQDTDSEILDTLCNRLQREWRFSRVDSRITVYLTSEDGVEAVKKLGSLVPPGFRLITRVDPLRRNPVPDLRDVEQRTVGCIRTPVSEGKTQRRLAGFPYPNPSVKGFEDLPLWKRFVSDAIRKRIQDEISSKLISLVQGELVSYQLTKDGVRINAKDDAAYRRIYKEYNGKAIDATDAEIYSLQFNIASQAPTNAQKSSHPPPSNHTETGKKGKGKQGLKGAQKGGLAGGSEEDPIISLRSYWRLAQQASNPGKPWVKTPWRPQDEPFAPTPTPRDYDVPIPTNVEKLQQKVAIWNAVNKVPQPEEETINAILSELPTEEERLAVMAQMRAGTANPYQLVRELSKMGKRIGPQDPAIYWLMLRVKLGKIMIAVRRIKRISSVRRIRIGEDLTKIVDRLKACGYTDADEVHLLYTGDTICIKDRSAFDTIDLIHLGPDDEDSRRPATVLMDYAADVYSLSEFGIVAFEEDGMWLWGDPDVVHHRLPKVLRIDEISDVIDPMEDVLWLSDAPRSKGRTFDKTHTGPLVINIMKGLLSDDESFTVGPLDFHALEPRHPSNIITCTTPEIIFVIDGIKPNHLFIIIMGPRVALHNAVKHLFAGSMKAEDVKFFEPYPVEYKHVQRIFWVIPHPGFHNYVPFARWTKEAFAQGLARICLIAATVKRLKPSTPNSHNLISQTLSSFGSSALNASLSTTLSLYGIRSPWNGATASNIGNIMDYKNITFKQALSVVSPKKNRGIITSLTPPTLDHARNDAPIIFPHVNNKLAYVGQMSFSVFCPASPENGVPHCAVKSILIDARWRSKVDDVEGYLMVDNGIEIRGHWSGDPR